jgi:hypothetical protein
MKRNKAALLCCGVVVALLVVVAVVFVALYFTVFRPRPPRVVAKAVRTEVSTLDILRFPPVINITVNVDVTVTNPNYASFRYGDVVTVVRYHGDGVGQTVMPAGEIGARATETVGVKVEVDTVRVWVNPHFPMEAFQGVLPFESNTEVVGKAVVMGRFKIRASSEVACMVDVYWTKGNSTSECTATVHV